MFLLFFLTFVIFAPFLFGALAYAFCVYLLGLVLFSKKIKLYSRNLALGVWDQGLATIWGQAPDISISEALGLAAIQNDQKKPGVSKPILWLGQVVDFLFCNRLYCIEKNHIRSSIDPGETWNNTVTHWHRLDKLVLQEVRDHEGKT